MKNIPSVLLDVSEVVTADNNGTFHLGGDDETLQDGTTDRNVGSERTLLIDVLSTDGAFGGLNAETNISVPTLIGLLSGKTDLTVGELILLLESSLVLQCDAQCAKQSSK